MNTQLIQKFNKVEAEYKATQEKLSALNNELVRLNLRQQIQTRGISRDNSAWFVANGKIHTR